MSITIPIRAKQSTASWGHRKFGHSLVKIRFILSITTFAVITSALVVGSVGSLTQTTSARSDGDRGSNYSGNSRDDRNGRNNDNNRNQPETNRSENKSEDKRDTTTPVSPTRTTPPSAKKQTPAPKTTDTTLAPTEPVQATPTAVVESEPVDTAAAVNQTTSARAADVAGQSVAYKAQSISEDTRNRLVGLAAVAGAVGALLFTMSYFAASPAARRTIPVRYISPMQEGVAS